MIQTIADALAAQGYETMTPVQDAVVAPELDGKDLLVSAQTGSGKTVAFGLAIAPTLLGEETHFGRAAAPLALIIAPTRELAMQVSRELTWLYGKAGAIVTTCVGGMDTRTERRALDRGAHIVVATPGRLCDHIKRNNIDLTDLRAVVLDEADEMLDLGFREDLEFILSESPEERRTLLFSATVPAAIAKLAQSYQRDAQRVSVVSDSKQHSDIEYRALTVNPRDTENAILNLLRFYEAKNAIVFCNTRAAVARLTSRLTNRNFSVVALSGELTQSERTNALQSLRDGRARVCVATDVAARGIDLPNLELVIHADLPTNADTLLHRSGRTGRAGRKGVSALIVPPKMRSKATRLMGWAKLKAEWGVPPSAAEVNAADQERLLNDDAWSTPAPEDAQEFVATLAERYTAEQLATAFVNLHRSRASAPEELSAPGEGRDSAPRAEFGKSVWFTVSTGRNDGAEPRTLLPMLCRVGDMTRDDIGAIRVQPRHSYVEVAEGAVGKLVNALGADMKAEDGVTLTRLDGVPEFGPRTPRPDNKGSGRARFDKEKRPHRGKSNYDPDAPKPPRKPRAPRDDAPADEYKPRKAESKPRSAPAKSKRDATRPPKSHKTERTPMKSGDKPKAKPAWKDKPRDAGGDKPASKAGKSGAKAVWKKPAKDGAPKRDAKPSSGYNRAADSSKRFTPPGGKGKKPSGGDARPSRSKR
ncbi:DEAD/DEAH box helicase [Sulfitobacter donghicola]|uniref:DEAD/DEAH box helicase n=1 Tax=Sulfitobacter donghicola DSW-25 = KCTC 12864 = JCM 14565 TaxID=1300350 RepID=A0A073IMB0_9RHOB|nr:DEAD/DEAH box helicase [Sulfitobacter donghicola]KEJ90889.1 DEAD/DEAH box helicase [Sulfitobacter donghicola DSW-25 = KCTC 12864 = JCM 14565]KIN68170.1 Dead-box protein, ATP-independent RNA helicase [Sulfitobacter donghicola DSW-25 = KCTC 12864 = JCM 14565]